MPAIPRAFPSGKDIFLKNSHIKQIKRNVSVFTQDSKEDAEKSNRKYLSLQGPAFKKILSGYLS